MSRQCSEDVSSTEQWEEHNESFDYDPPEKDPELWSSEDYTELWDRTIGRRVEWTCEYCSQPFGSLKKARRHVENRHSEQLLEKAQARRSDV